MGDFLRFWRRSVAKAFPHWERGEAVMAYLVPFATKAIIWLLALGSLGAIVLPPWFLTAALPFALLLFIWAPFQVWREDEGKAAILLAELNSMREGLRPRLAVEPITRDDGRLESACLQVTNLGNGAVRDCSGRLFSVEIESDTHGPEVDRAMHSTYLQWSSKDGGGRETTFHSQAALDVAELSGKAFPLVVFQSDQRDQYRLVGGFSYLLDIEIASENAGSVRRKYRLKSNQAGFRIETFQAVRSP